MFYYCLFPILKKTYYFYYFLGIVSYLRDSSIQYLEVKFDSKQSFNDHVRFINNKASAKITFQSQRSFNQLFSLFLQVKKDSKYSHEFLCLVFNIHRYAPQPSKIKLFFKILRE